MRKSSRTETPMALVTDHVPSDDDAEDLYEHAPSGYLSTLPDGTIIRVNRTLLSWTGYQREDLVERRRFVDLLSAGGRIYHETHFAPLLAMQGRVREIALDLVCADGSRLPVLINSILVRTPHGAPDVIRTSVFNATDRRKYERELLRARERAERSEARAKELAQTLQQSLMPPSLPFIPGVELGAVYRAAGSEDEVGGDFYDVFETGDGNWAVVLGDVCGKGAEAAVVTALVRYTARAVAMRTRRPSAILSAVNAALLRQGTDRFATVLCLRVRPNVPGGPAMLTVSSAGHALPIQVSGSRLATVGRDGMLLGVVEDPELHDVTVELKTGEGVFCYTDGLTEGRRGVEFFGAARFEATLKELSAEPPTVLTRAIIDRAVEFQRGHPVDDMAALFMRIRS